MSHADIITISKSQLASLSGTDKQVKCAQDIRDKMMDRMASRLSGATEDQARAAMEMFVEVSNTKTNAAWWIDERTGLPEKSLNDEYLAIVKARGLA